MEYVIGLVLYGAATFGIMKVFEKAGVTPTWAAFVPFYNGYLLTLQVAKKEVIWFVLCLIPFVGIVAAVLICIEIAKKFGKSAAFGVGLGLLSFVFFPILGMSDAKYEGSAA